MIVYSSSHTIRSSRRVLGSCAVAALLFAGCSKSDSKSPSTENDSPKTDSLAAMADMPDMAAKGPAAPIAFTSAQIQHGGVKWGPVSMGTASGTAVIPGEVTPNEDRTARLGAPVGGRILTVPVRPGDHVSKGQLLVTMQSPEAGMAQSDVAKADAELSARKAEAQYAASARARADRLLALKAIPRQDYELAISDDEHARAAVAQAEAEARRARATAEQLSVGATTSGEVALRAPSSGVVLSRTAVPGTVVDAGAPLVVITEPSQLWLIINAPEQLAALFHRDGRVRFTVPAYPADTFPARIDAVGAGLEPETRTLTVRAVVANRDGRLKPRMLANTIVEGAGRTTAAFVPDDAVQMLQGKPHVFLVRTDENGGATFTPREIVIGARSGGRVAILHGLAAGDVVVVAGSFAVKAEVEKRTMPKMEM
jgi:cobalt-zinc-cadmium efflux system membrane fusion protein